MKVKVKSVFRDKDNYDRVYQVGEDVEFEDERAKDLISRKLAEEVKSKSQK